MSPKPDDDLFIEPADDEDVVYGDYNNTMDGASSSGPRPYIRLTSQLKNVTRDAGGEARFRCEAVGTPPLNFIWLLNNAPVEKSRRIKIRTKENSSRLVVTDLHVLDSGYYQCVVSNSAASVNTTSILRVNNVPDAVLKSRKSKTQSLEDYEDYELMDRGRLPDEEDADLYRVPNDAAGHGYIPAEINERWLDGMKYRAGDCVPYRGEACRQYLTGRHVMLTSENREDMYDIDRNLRAAMIFINNSPTISQQCRQISQAVACFHMYKVCDSTTANKQALTICKKDCDRIQKDVCPQELALAAQHELVGDGPKALFPSCPALPHSSSCIPLLDSQLPTSSETPKPHWCYTNIGTTYEGAISTTMSGKSCMTWKDVNSREYTVDRYPELRSAKNHCRNPGGKKTRPWCFSQPMGQEEYCDIQPCPKEMYPGIGETPKDNNGISATDSVANYWESLTPQWQYGVMIGGVSIFVLLFLLICCICCCKAKKKKGKTRGGQMNHLSAPPSIVNSAVNSAYYRKLNGTSTPIVGRGAGPMEMAHLLPNQMGIPPPYQDQFRQQEIMEEPYTVRDISPSQLTRGTLIGEGQFGMLHLGQWSGAQINGEPIQVAIKSVRIDPTNADIANLEEEIRTVAAFDHPHVVKLLGICYWNTNNMSAIFEFMVHGDLHEFLRLRDPGQAVDHVMMDNEEFMRIATQISYGMEYLATMNFIHRDLATRNCLVWDNHMIKIADFPLMKKCHEHDYYRMLHRPWTPVRWISKEALELGNFSEASDVWSFGVTLWEIWNYGRQPYEGYTNQQVIEFIANRNLLECPPNCPTKIYSLMVECWHEHPNRRPNFSELHNRLQAWSVASPAHSILNPARNSNSSQSGSSMSGRGLPKPIGVSSTRQTYNPRGGRRLEDASPLMRREGNYTYSEDDVESD